MNTHFKQGFTKVALSALGLGIGAGLTGLSAYGIKRKLEKRKQEKREARKQEHQKNLKQHGITEGDFEYAAQNKMPREMFLKGNKTNPYEFTKQNLTKKASGGKFYHAAELAGLGALALPSALHLATGRDMKAKPYHMLETAGLGILAAPSIVSLMKGLKKLK